MRSLLIIFSSLLFSPNTFAVDCGIYKGGSQEPVKTESFVRESDPSKPSQILTYFDSQIGVSVSYSYDKDEVLVVWMNVASQSEVSTAGGFGEDGIFSSAHSTGEIIEYYGEKSFRGDQDFRVKCSKASL